MPSPRKRRSTPLRRASPRAARRTWRSRAPTGGSGVAGYQCELDGAGYACCAGPIDYSGLGDGPHSFAVRAIDNVGNVDASPATASWTVDATPPPPPLITQAPSDPSAEPNPTLLFTDSDPTAVFRCQLDGGSFTDCPGSFSAALADGPHVFGVKAIDPALNESTVTTHSWTVDTVAPGTTIDAAPPSLTSSRSAHLAFHGTDGGSGVAGYQCELDGAAYAGCASPIDYSGLGDGPHSFAVRAIDNVGNVDASPATASWTVDATPPPPPQIQNPPSDPSADPSPTFEFSDSDPTAGFACQIDGGSFASCPGSFTPAAPLADGPHVFGVKAIDPALNQSTVTTHSWTVDTVHPLVTIAERPPLLTNQTGAQFVFAANKAGSSYECALDSAAFASCTSPKPYSGLGDGSHTFAVRAIWLALLGPATTYSWTVDSVPPETTITSGPPGESQSAAATFTFASSEPPSTFTCSLDGGGFARARRRRPTRAWASVTTRSASRPSTRRATPTPRLPGTHGTSAMSDRRRTSDRLRTFATSGAASATGGSSSAGGTPPTVTSITWRCSSRRSGRHRRARSSSRAGARRTRTSASRTASTTAT